MVDGTVEVVAVLDTLSGKAVVFEVTATVVVVLASWRRNVLFRVEKDDFWAFGINEYKTSLQFSV